MAEDRTDQPTLADSSAPAATAVATPARRAPRKPAAVAPKPVTAARKAAAKTAPPAAATAGKPAAAKRAKRAAAVTPAASRAKPSPAKPASASSAGRPVASSPGPGAAKRSKPAAAKSAKPAATKRAAAKAAKPAAAKRAATPPAPTAKPKPAAPATPSKRAAARPAKPAAAPKPMTLAADQVAPTPKPDQAKPKPPAAKRRFNPFAPIGAYARFAERALTRMIPEQSVTADKLIDQIAAGKQGPEVIAAFDFDGTLIGGLSGGMLMRERMRRKEVTRGEIAETIGVTFKTMAKLVEANELVAKAFAQWKGKSEGEMEELGAHLYETALQDSVFPEMQKIVEAHRAAGHTLVVATSASRFQVEPTVKALGIDNLLCTQLEVAEGRLTGKLVGDSLFGIGKVNAIKRFVAERGGNLADVHFYADGSEEVGLMEAVGHPHPVNPGGRLAEAAKNRHWPVLRLTSRGGSRPIEVARGLAGMMSLLPNLYAGVAVGAITRDKRAIGNTVMPAWMERQLQTAGVKLRVTGRRNLWARRPAVFIFNHRNNFDGMFCAVLVRTDYVSIAKKEMSKNPVGKLVSQLTPTVFVERAGASAKEAAATMQPVVDAVRDGYSIILAPEGTRTRGHPNSVGPFKKGAFHMAMAAGIPVVPVVIRNALDVCSRDGPAMRPGTVDVAVLPPVSVENWDPANLGKHVEEVRQMFIATLNDWPAPDEPE